MPIIRRLATTLTLVSILALAPSARATEVSVFATGLDAPRGLTFGPDGALYVAEAGSGGTATTVNVCPELQLPPPLGPVMNGPTARISRIGRGGGGVRSTIVDGLPSSVTQLGGDYVGVADVAFVKRRLYAVVAGGGCSNGEADPNRPNGVIRIDRPGSWSYVANLSAYYMAHPVANPDPADFTPDGVPYDVVAKRGAIYVLEANSGALDRFSVKSGAIERVVDISATQGHVVPTALDWRGGDFFVGTLGRFPIEAGAQHIYRISRDGQIEIAASGLTALLGVAFDHRGRLYVLETSSAGPFPQPSSGRILRLSRFGQWRTIAEGLNYPTAMIFGPDGALYVSVNGYNLAPGDGQILRIPVSSHHHHHHHDDDR